MSRFVFWQRWLLVASLVIIAFGLLMALFNQHALFDTLFNQRIDPAFWSGDPESRSCTAFQAWAYGVLGATVAGWGILIAFIAHFPFKNRERWSWNALAAALGLWFIVDTSISLYYGVSFNAVFNTLLLVLAGLPLAFTRRYFSGS